MSREEFGFLVRSVRETGYVGAHQVILYTRVNESGFVSIERKLNLANVLVNIPHRPSRTFDIAGLRRVS